MYEGPLLAHRHINTGTYVYAGQIGPDVCYEKDGSIQGFPGVAAREAELPRIVESNIYLQGVDWVVYPALLQNGKPLEPFNTTPISFSEQNFNNLFVPIKEQNPLKKLRQDLTDRIDRYIRSSRLSDEDEALGPFLRKGVEPITREDIANAKQYLIKLEHVVILRDFIKN